MILSPDGGPGRAGPDQDVVAVGVPARPVPVEAQAGLAAAGGHPRLRTALDQGRPVTVDTRYHKPGPDGLQQDGLVTGDAKTGGGDAYLLDYGSRAGNDVMLTLRNP